MVEVLKDWYVGPDRKSSQVIVEGNEICVKAWNGHRSWDFSNKPRKFTNFLKEYFKDRDDLVGVEIGVYRAENLSSLNEHLKCKLLIGVDCWTDQGEFPDSHREIGAAVVDGKDEWNYLWMANGYLEAWWRTHLFKNVMLIRGYSIATASLMGQVFDFVYLDGGHKRKDLESDCKAWYPKIKIGGILGGHDWEVETVHQGVCDYFGEGRAIYLGDADWYVIKDH
jgi:hypothetical protein